MSTANPFPLPAIITNPVTHTVAANTLFWRVHPSKYAERTFNPGLGNARFSPINDSSGAPIPTMYAGSHISVALMETVYHDVSFGQGLKTYDRSRFGGLVISCITSTRPLCLAKLFGPATRNYPLEHGGLTQSDALHYPSTREWARALHASGPIDGLIWVSRQDSGQMALMLFGDRVSVSDLQIIQPSFPITEHPDASVLLEELAAEMRVILLD
ncbi:RES family NAD+ phosphorylase [Aeromonas veronii]